MTLDNRQRILSPERIKRFEEIGFVWEILEEQFEKGFQETLLYKERTGNPNAIRFYQTNEGFRLGIWQSSQSKFYRDGRMSPERIKRFEEIGFIWDKFEKQFEKGFQETLLYNEKFGNPNAIRFYRTDEGYKLGFWQSTQREKYRKGNLSSEKIRRLEDIGFTWTIGQTKKSTEAFERGFQETLLYKESTRNPNATQSHKTDEGYRLGSWQNNQRMHYKKGNLSPDRIKRLEDIGFKWRI
jgi:rRNA maturation protein Rpf1